MEQLSEKIFADCQVNYKLTLRKFKMIKSTPKAEHYLFLPLTREETVRAWGDGIKRYLQGMK